MKKGFTLVEIILSIALITIIGVGFTMGIVIYQNKQNTDKLEAMSGQIYTAVHLLVETDEDTKRQVYEKKNGAIIPLSKLESEGLVDFQDIDIENEAVITMLGSPYGEDACSGSLYDVSTWSKSSGDIIYICGNSGSSGSNFVAVGGVADNLSKATREVYYFKGLNVSNYVKLDGSSDLFRILSVDKDDSLTIYTEGESFNNLFTSSQILPVAAYRSLGSHYYLETTLSITCSDNIAFFSEYSRPTSSISDNVNGVLVDVLDFAESIECYNNIPSTWIYPSPTTSTGNYLYFSNQCHLVNYSGYYVSCGNGSNSGAEIMKKLRLKPCMKIISGTGDIANPYIIKPNNCV